jgi:hypothetical protein
MPMYYGMIGAESDVELTMPASGAVTDLHVRTRTVVSIIIGDYDFFIRKTGADTAVTCVITTNGTTCSDTTHCADYTAGTDTISVRAAPTNLPLPVGAGWTAVFHPETTCADLGF